MDPTSVLFPHDQLREVQAELVEDVAKAIQYKSHLIAHAPTGLGKTAATLAPALAYAIKNKLTVLFVTSRHTQHLIAMQTIAKIKEKYKIDLPATSIIGKKWMCLHPGVEQLSSGEFSEYCKAQREEKACEFYVNTRKDDYQKTLKAEAALAKMLKISPIDAEKTKEVAKEEELCPYEMGLLVAAHAKAIVTDYYYVFHPNISDGFMQKIKLDLDKCILIIDEGHNLPARLRELMTAQISDLSLDFAQKEAQKHHIDDAHLFELKSTVERLGERLAPGQERLVKKQELIDAIAQFVPIQEFIKDCAVGEATVLEQQKRSSIGNVGEFLMRWLGPDEGFARIISRKESQRGASLTLSYRCLDPSLVTEDVIKKTHSTILMSGTLTPTSMFRDLLRFPKNTTEKEYASPFDKKNRLAIIVPKTTTKFSDRSEQQYKDISKQCLEIVEAVPGNVAVFFPSYFVLNAVHPYLSTATTKTVFTEAAGLSKQDREGMLEAFKQYKDSGAVLLGVSAGSFGEGIDLPGDLLKAVVVVGVPLSKPDLETQELIRYYDLKFRRGWDYGYVLPAITKVLQNAGRCIRSETDRGVIVFLDERYAQPRYLSTFPKSWNLKIKMECRQDIEEFFENS